MGQAVGVAGARRAGPAGIAQIEDIGQRKAAEEQLRAYSDHLAELALHDPVTGLRNHRDFQVSLDKELQRARRHGGPWSVVLFDIQGFADINDGAGRLEGDRVLGAVGAALERACRASDRAARIGSDEFALLLPETGARAAAHTARRIAREVASDTGGVSLSWGAGSWPADGDSKELVLLRADTQLHQHKAAHQRAAPSAGTASQPPAGATGIDNIVALARRQLGMDVAYVAELSDGRQEFPLDRRGRSLLWGGRGFGDRAG